MCLLEVLNVLFAHTLSLCSLLPCSDSVLIFWLSWAGGVVLVFRASVIPWRNWSMYSDRSVVLLVLAFVVWKAAIPRELCMFAKFKVILCSHTTYQQGAEPLWLFVYLLFHGIALFPPYHRGFVSLTVYIPNKMPSILRTVEAFHQQKRRVKRDVRACHPSCFSGDFSQLLNHIDHCSVAISQDISVKSPNVRQSRKAYSLSRIYVLITCERHHVPS